MAALPTREQMHAAFAQRHGADLQQKLESSTVAVCGLGGLGSNISIALARAGVGRLILIDFDHVDVTNLHRQQYKVRQIGMPKTEALAENLGEIAPYTRLTLHQIRLDETNIAALLSEADIICEAFDKPECKAMLVNAVLADMPEKVLVSASGMAGMGSANCIQTRRIARNFYLCGDGESDVQAAGSLFASRVMVCAAHQAHAVVRIIAGNTEA